MDINGGYPSRCAAIIWNLFTWWQGIPSSSSALLGFCWAAIAHAGFGLFLGIRVEGWRNDTFLGF
jgi:phosphate/sulfate permease